MHALTLFLICLHGLAQAFFAFHADRYLLSSCRRCPHVHSAANLVVRDPLRLLAQATTALLPLHHRLKVKSLASDAFEPHLKATNGERRGGRGCGLEGRRLR